MSECKYSVAELDALRQACETKWLFGRYRPSGGGFSRQWVGDEKVRAVEHIVRTHMLAGHVAEDLYASESPNAS